MKEDLSELITRAESKLESIDAMADRLGELYEKGLEKSAEAKRIESGIKALFYEVLSLLNEAKKVLKLKPDKFALLRLGDVYYSLTYRSYDEELEKESREKAMECYMGAFVEHMKEFPEILKRIGFITPLSPKDRKAFLSKFGEVFGLKSFEEAALGFARAELEARIKREERQLAECQLKMLKMYLDVYPDDVDALLEAASRYAILLENYPTREDYREDCEAILEKALKVSPNDPKVLGRAYRICEKVLGYSSGEKRRQLLNKSIELLRKLREVDPTSSFPWIQLSRIYGMYTVTDDRERDLEEAIRCMEEAIRRDGSWLRWQYLGELYLRKGDKEKMLECYSKAFDEYFKEARRGSTSEPKRKLE